MIYALLPADMIERIKNYTLYINIYTQLIISIM